jgi:hypothetical protein
VIKLLTLWATWRLLRVLIPILVVATLALFLLGGASRRGTDGVNVVGRLQHRARPLQQQLQHVLQKAFEP